MEDKKYSDEPCSKCGETFGTFKIRLDTICNSCAEDEESNLVVEVIKTCLGCNNSEPVNLASLELLEHINKHLEEMEVVDG